MPTLETAGLTVQERGIIASRASARYSGELLRAEHQLVSVYRPSARRTRERPYYSRGQEIVVQWEDSGQPIPAWFDILMQGFVDLLTLPVNWDSYGAGPIDTKIIQRALDSLDSLMRASTPAPRVVPLSSGGLQVEWHRKGIDLEIVFDKGEEPFFYYKAPSGEESEHSLALNTDLLISIIRNLE